MNNCLSLLIRENKTKEYPQRRMKIRVRILEKGCILGHLINEKNQAWEEGQTLGDVWWMKQTKVQEEFSF